MAERSYRIATIPGDGIGVDVTAAALRVLDVAAAGAGFELRWNHFDWNCERYLSTGRMMPADGLDQLRRHDAIFLGAIGFPGVPDDVSLWGLLMPIRRAFQQYVNLRPVRLFPRVPTPLAGRLPSDIDMVIVRENCEGEYSQIGGRHNVGRPDELAVQQALFTRVGVSRIATYAFEVARARGGTVTSATKSNGIIHTMPFWDAVCREIADRYPDVPFDQCHVDALAARLVLAPQRVDVIVASNLFGDILSDVAAAVAGSLGVAPSGNINPEQEFPSMFESVHGSAPDMSGKGIANPVAQILAGAMMLDYLGEKGASAAVGQAVADALSDEAVPLTPDLGGTATTGLLTNAIIAKLATVEGGRARTPIALNPV